MKQQKKNRKFKGWSEIFIGVGLLLVGIILWIVKVNGIAVGSYLGIGSFIIGGASSFIFGSIKHYMEQKRDISILDEAISKWRTEATQSSLNIRSFQYIEFVITRYSHNGNEYLQLVCSHRYSYKHGSCTAERILIDTFNDMAISTTLNETLPKDKQTRFMSVLISKGEDEPIPYDAGTPHQMSNFILAKDDAYARPGFKMYTDGIKVNDYGKIDISFKINNTHMLKSKHAWYFEQISEGFTLVIRNKTELPSDKFTLTINHPEREKIESKNSDYIDTHGKLKGVYTEIKVPYVILPYQGFVLSWDFLSADNQPEVSDDPI